MPLVGERNGVMKEILISIVVPVYNVELYLKKCLESLLDQTYQNYEIILVDDGSTDNSGLICDQYAVRHANIVALHKPNGGTADARNFAIPYLKGDYVAYVDADDYVETTYLSDMAAMLDETYPDMAITGYYIESPEGKILKNKTYQDQYKEFTPDQALTELCYERNISTFPCGKLINANIIKKNLFPKDNSREDLATIYKMIGASKKIVFSSKLLYHYIQRQGSKQNSEWNGSMPDVMSASTDLLKYIRKNYPNVYPAAIYRYFFSANELYAKACRSKEYLSIISPYQNELKAYWPVLQKDDEVPFFRKLQYGIMTFQPFLYKYVRKILCK